MWVRVYSIGGKTQPQVSVTSDHTFGVMRRRNAESLRRTIAERCGSKSWVQEMSSTKEGTGFFFSRHDD